MRRRIFGIVCAMALCAAFAGRARADPAKLGELSVEDVAKKLGSKLYVFDCNPRDEFLDGHVPGARWVEFSHVTAADLPADKHAMLVFYCENEH